MKYEILFASCLTPEQQDKLKNALQIQQYAKGQPVHRHGESCVGLILVQKGSLSFSLLSEEGREITIFRLGSGESCVLSAACVFQGLQFHAQITAEESSEVAILSAPVLAQLMEENHDVERIVYKMAVSRFASMTQTFQQILFLSLEKRLALFLQEESRHRSSAVIPATHEQIARCIGSSREVVTRMLNQFAARHIVSLERGSVKILDQDALAEVLY